MRFQFTLNHPLVLTLLLTGYSSATNLLHVNQDHPTTTKRKTQTSDSVLADIENAIDDITSLLQQQNNLGPRFIRLGFHDCVGGCDGCVDLSNPDNSGLDVPIDALTDIVDIYEQTDGLSRADIWALAAITAANFALPQNSNSFFSFDFYKRVNCQENPKGGPDRQMPSFDLTTDGLLDFFADEFGFSDQETCAIMGAHTLGEARRQNLGFDGKWVDNNSRLDNEYYQQIVGNGNTIQDWIDAPNWNQRMITNGRFNWTRGGQDGRGGRGGRSDGGRRRQPRGRGSRGLYNVLYEELIGNRNLQGRGRRPDGGNNGRGPPGGGNRGNNGRGPPGGNNGRGPPEGEGGNGGGGNRGGGGRLIMLNSDIALVRDFSSSIDNGGEISCQFENNNACPAAETLPQMAAYRNNNDLWLNDFKDVFERMLIHRYDPSASCGINDTRCVQII